MIVLSIQRSKLIMVSNIKIRELIVLLSIIDCLIINFILYDSYLKFLKEEALLFC